MLFRKIDIVDENFRYLPSQWVGTEGSRITYISSEKPQDSNRFGEVYDGNGKLLMPALYNAHAHAAMTLLRGYAENLPLQSWLNDSVWPFEAKMTPEDNYWATLLACAEMARYGTVSFSDMYYAMDERIAAVNEAHMKTNICEGLIAFEEKPYADYPICADNEQWVKKYHLSSEGRIRVDYNIHAEYTSNPQTCADIAKIAKDKGLRIHMHVSETKAEHEECKERHHGMTPFQYFESLGVLDVPVTAAHCVWVDDNDLEIIKNHHVFVAANPASNMKLGSGFAPIPKMLDEGISVCLGTDGVASNNNHDMFQDMYLLASIYKGFTHDPSVISPTQVLQATSRMGALSQGREDCGLIQVGAKADLCVLDTTGPSFCPATDPICNVVFAGHGSDVVLTLCDGHVTYRDGDWPDIDLEKVKGEVSARTQRIISSL
ncbi:MAG: amidohydrolase [Eggerthellaceae bacterium]|jgi:5-methylthioadenosine/S-adenosylhomocysteine deaminase